MFSLISLNTKAGQYFEHHAGKVITVSVIVVLVAGFFSYNFMGGPGHLLPTAPCKGYILSGVAVLFVIDAIRYTFLYKKQKTNSIVLSQNYNVIFKSKLLDNPENARIFLCAEAHDDQTCQNLNNQFIKERVGPEALLLLESLSTEFVMSAKDLVAAGIKSIDLATDPSLANSLIVRGWDFSETFELQKQIRELNTVLDQANTQVNLLKKQSSKLMGSDLQGEERVQELSKNSDALRAAKYLYNKNKWKQHELIASTFPQRTRAMVEAIRKAKQWISNTGFKGNIFLIAGRTHLQTPDKFKNDPRYSLVELHEELDRQEAVVIVPKHLNLAS